MTTPDRLMEVYSTDDASEAEVLRSALHAEGIKCEIDGERQAGFTGLTSLEIKLLVLESDLDRAQQFIDSHQR